MPSCWGKSSSKKVNRKENRESIIETIRRKLKSTFGEKRNDKSRWSRRHHNETISAKGSTSFEPSRSSSPSTHVSRCQSFAERPRAQPLPLPGLHLPSTNHANSGISVTSKLESNGGSKPSLYCPLPKPGYVSNREEPADAEGDIATASVSSGSSTDSDDQSDSHFHSPVSSDCENGNRTTIHGTFSVAHNDQSPITLQKNSRASSKPAPQLCNHQLISNSPKVAPLHLPNLQIACSGGLWSAPDSSISSPSRSPVRTFAERPRAQPLPLPGLHLPSTNHANSGISVTSKLESNGGSKPSLYCPLPKPGYVSNREEPADAEGDIATASVSSGSSTDSDDQSDSHFLSPMSSDCEIGNRTTIHGTFSVAHNDHCSGGLWSAPDSSISSPPRSPVRTFGLGQVLNSDLCTGMLYSDIASGHCSSPGSGYNSGHNSVGGDLSGQTFWPQSRCSPECSPIPSPGMTSPGLSSRIHSDSVTPLHPRARGAATESSTRRPDDAKQRSHRLPLPPITVPNSCPFSPTYYATTSTSVPRSPGISENITSPGSRWKKGQLLGRGTYGHVYLGFNSESGEMCAMKEVTLFSDDARSRECAQQLDQEIALLSRLWHPNIVQYYGSETVDDKLYIYLEYVSGGSIYKLLQQYGQLGEIAIRNYTRQILLGLAYLHAKNTVHRDIKGANILVDPNGRVKLADFGMAKHISGQSCPLSFKGSPYWMAPEFIQNSNGCNLAVDIWSLGCTVLEMATTKPPWSQYEGVAALFKAGYSKELPAIPDHLSEEGKDFVRLCLQRNPLRRPSAAQLLMHPFVKKATPQRSVLSADPSEATPAITNAAIRPEKHNLCIDSEVAGIYLSKSLRTGAGLSDNRIPRNVSRPVSPTRSPLLHSRSLHMSGRMSSSPISSPHTASGSSTPLTGGCGAIPFHQTKQPTFSYEGVGVSQRPQNGLYSNGNTAYQERINDPFCGILQTAETIIEGLSSNEAPTLQKS